jgi:hypothetical protein
MAPDIARVANAVKIFLYMLFSLNSI